jgi:hypothetical protein
VSVPTRCPDPAASRDKTGQARVPTPLDTPGLSRMPAVGGRALRGYKGLVYPASRGTRDGADAPLIVPAVPVPRVGMPCPYPQGIPHPPFPRYARCSTDGRSSYGRP